MTNQLGATLLGIRHAPGAGGHRRRPVNSTLLASTLLLCALQGISMTLTLWAGCLLIFGGAVICKFGVVDDNPAGSRSPGAT